MSKVRYCSGSTVVVVESKVIMQVTKSETREAGAPRRMEQRD